ncbi:hypothetical protein [Streptomyces rubiginosohelvolus]|uniref:Uncharacterized protein n=1 Tax=Streptomyces rubiginosohelvolus TaxID=67362 RepID=A0ABQ3BP74_9ACTN|nr:hypothetical protein [Streptomyces pluricolorescens]GGZ53107.1 hypothetical protein GCM10010328_29900 [Streptomyces pluricolorescens]
MSAEDVPEISPERAAAQYLAGQEAALQSCSPAAEPDTASQSSDDTTR